MPSSFSNAALDYNALGISTLPVENKRPCVKGFNKWRGMRENTVQSFIKSFPDAEIAILTRLAKIIVVDIDSDDPSLIAWVADEFGYSPLWVKTRRGYHIYYSNPNSIQGCIGNGDYRIDLKGAGASDYVVAPPCEGYSFLSMTLDKVNTANQDKALQDFISIISDGLPPINSNGIAVFFKHHSSLRPNAKNDNHVEGRERKGAELKDRKLPINRHMFDFRGKVIQEGQRNVTLWRWGMKQASIIGRKVGHTEQAFQLLQRALSDMNAKFCNPSLSSDDMQAISNSIWYEYELKGKNHFNTSHKTMMSDVIVSVNGVLLSMGNPKAFALLKWLKSQYSENNEFILNRPGLAKLTGMSEGIIQKAVTHLRQQGYVLQISKSNRHKRISARYKFTDKSNKLISKVSSDIGFNDNDIPALEVNR